MKWTAQHLEAWAARELKGMPGYTAVLEDYEDYGVSLALIRTSHCADCGHLFMWVDQGTDILVRTTDIRQGSSARTVVVNDEAELNALTLSDLDSEARKES